MRHSPLQVGGTRGLRTQDSGSDLGLPQSAARTRPSERPARIAFKPLKLSVTEAGPWRVAPVLVRTAQWPEPDFRRHGAAPRKGRLEHGGIVAAQSADLRSLARQTTRRLPQGDEVFDAGADLKRKARRHYQPVNKDPTTLGFSRAARSPTGVREGAAERRPPGGLCRRELLEYLVFSAEADCLSEWNWVRFAKMFRRVFRQATCSIAL